MLSSLEGKTILQIVPSLDVGGAERSTLDIAAAIVRAGGRSFVISAGGRMVDELERTLPGPRVGESSREQIRTSGRGPSCRLAP